MGLFYDKMVNSPEFDTKFNLNNLSEFIKSLFCELLFIAC